MSADDIQARTLAELGEVKGQLAAITQLITLNQAATHQRIDDLRHAMTGRMDGHENRLGRLEQNERGTAIRAGATGALAAALVTATVEGLKAVGR